MGRSERWSPRNKASGFKVSPATTALAKSSALRYLEKTGRAVPFVFTVRGISIYWASPIYQHDPNPTTGSFDYFAGLPIRRTNHRTIGQSEGIHVVTEFEFADELARLFNCVRLFSAFQRADAFIALLHWNPGPVFRVRRYSNFFASAIEPFPN
jgi:hypothetical protein